MRTITITRREGPLGGHVDLKIMSNNNVLGEMKADEKVKTFEVAYSEQAVQAELLNSEEVHYRSNVHFAIYGKKDIKLFLTISGTRLVLAEK